MAYVPPHKRLSNSQEGPTLTPAKMLPKFKKNYNSSKSHSNWSGNNVAYGKKVLYADECISKWLAIPLIDDVHPPSSLRLVPVNVESLENKLGEISLALVKDHSSQQECHDIMNKSCDLEQAWASIVERVYTDLLSAIQNARKEMAEHTLQGTIKTEVVARFGKVLFRWNPTHQDHIEENTISESYIRNLKRFFYTNVPIEYMEHVKCAIVPELGVHFEEEKELYYVMLADVNRPETTIACKCKVLNAEKKLQMYKIELYQIRHMVVDLSCLENDLDLRLALCAKTILTLQDDEEETINELISSAIFDPKVKGGLKWPLGKANSGGRYSVVGVWHTKSGAYSNSLMRLKLREADRFDFLTTKGEAKREIFVKLKGINKILLEQGSDAVGCLTMLEDALDMIKNNFLAWKGTLVSWSESC